MTYHDPAPPPYPKWMPPVTYVDADGNVKLNLNVIYHADNLKILRAMPDACIDLIYLDPPFATGKDWFASPRVQNG